MNDRPAGVRITSSTPLVPTLRVSVYIHFARPWWWLGTPGERRGTLNDSHRRRLSHGIPELEQEAERRLLGKQWPGTSVMRGCTPLRLQWVRGTSQWWLSFGSPPFRGHFCPLQWAFCPLPAFCQRLTLRVCSFFCLFFLSPQENKTWLKPRLFIHLPLLLFFIMTFGSVSSCVLCSLHECVEMFFMRQTEDGNDSCAPHPTLHMRIIEKHHSPALSFYVHRSDYATRVKNIMAVASGTWDIIPVQYIP